VLVSFVYVVACRLFALVLLLGRSDGSKELEIILLRHELAILRRHTRREECQNSDSRFEEVWQRCDLAADSGRFASALPVRSRLGSLVRLFGARARAITRNR